jgi:hypothetical protein
MAEKNELEKRNGNKLNYFTPGKREIFALLKADATHYG